ncbi:MAG: shikimate dehydrogenase [Firmicutes bacterium]|nr:shikimate dehydrogenase [Bacillota bacterium]
MQIMVISASTKILGIIGWPVAHSLSPAMHNAAFAAMGLDWAYVPLPVRPGDLPRAIAGLLALGLRGANVTIPHKEEALKLMDQVSPGAELIGAVNTIVCEDGRLIGHNTDGIGFLRSLEGKWSPQGETVVILGAGGSARAIAMQLALTGVEEIHLINRNSSRACRLAEEIEARLGVFARGYGWTAGDLDRIIGSCSLLVNATAFGMGDEKESLFPYEWLSAKTVVCDIVYTPRLTGLLKGAARQGCVTVDGLGMLLHQGAAALEIWSGRPAPLQAMARALEDALPGD